MRNLGVALAIVLATCGLARADEPVAKHGERQKDKSEAKPSEPVEKDGLSVVIVPTKRVFAVWEPLRFSVTYRNVSKHAFRLPDQPGYYNYWQMNLTKASKDKGKETTYTGRTSLPMGLAMPQQPSAALQPGKTFTVEAKLDSYTYSEGTWNRAAASKELPLGKYKVSFDIRFPAPPAFAFQRGFAPQTPRRRRPTNPCPSGRTIRLRPVPSRSWSASA